ncbi:hypothetical protein [Streptomyces sp. IBSBF 2435]|uniref:hypothetical protein n=1 Tax=Streptomyces sp. IBSBF 2435 TaxID=2903531 RepID=UPI002FDC6943
MIGVPAGPGGWLAATSSDLPELLDVPPRPVRELIADAVRAGGYVSQSVPGEVVAG